MLRQLGIKYEGPAVALEADPTFWAADKEDIDRVAHGCGPGWGDWLVPDTVWGGLSIRRACRIHDWDYVNGTEKAKADLRFKANMERIVIACTRWNWLKRLRLSQVNLYYKAVKYAGDTFYAHAPENRGFNFL